MKVELTKWEKENYHNGGFDSLIRRFNRLVQESGILKEIKEREYYEKPSTKANKKKYQAELKKQRKEKKNTLAKR